MSGEVGPAVSAADGPAAVGGGKQGKGSAAAPATGGAASPSKKPRSNKPWYSSESLLAARVPIGFVMHIGAHFLMTDYNIVLQLAIIPLIWWELAHEFPNRRYLVQAALTVASFADMYILFYHSEIDIWQVAFARLAVSVALCLASGVKHFDSITVNYLLLGITAALFLFQRYPPQVFIAISMAIAGSDCMQYFVGKLIGRTKIVPKISPNKSLEGYLGAFVGCNLIYYFWLAENSLVTPLQAGIYVNGLVFCGICGDLFISWWKRNHKLKDTSSLLLAHGGFLDRLDSHIGAYLWSVSFSFALGLVGENFTAMKYDHILILIAVAWTALWTHFFARRLLG